MHLFRALARPCTPLPHYISIKAVKISVVNRFFGDFLSKFQLFFGLVEVVGTHQPLREHSPPRNRFTVCRLFSYFYKLFIICNKESTLSATLSAGGTLVEYANEGSSVLYLLLNVDHNDDHSVINADSLIERICHPDGVLKMALSCSNRLLKSLRNFSLVIYC